MRPKLISILVASLFVASPLALAAEGGGMTWTGEASLGLRYTNDTALDRSKLNEYRDLGSTAPLTTFDAKGRGDNYYLNLFGENLGRDDMFLDLKGGKYGVFKYQLYDNELRHNFGSGFGARSPYAGIGSATLTAVFPNGNPNTWNTFDHSYSRRDLGGMFEVSANTPWYFRVEANEVKREGINVIAGAQGTSPGNGNMDLPAPIDYTALNYSAEGGYSSKAGHFAVNWMQSRFTNGNALLNWSNGFFGGVDTTVLAPSNDLMKLSANGNMRQLPGNSTVAGRFTYSKLTNDLAVRPTMLSTPVVAGVGTVQPTGSNSPTFHGEVVKKTVSLSLNSHPAKDLDTRVYWNWYREDSRSTQMVFTPAQASGLYAAGTGPNCNNNVAPAAPSPCVPEPFNLRKNNLGIEAGYRLNTQNKVSGGFDWYDIERERVDFIGTLDRKVFAEWKNSSLDALTGRLKYQYLERRSDWRVDPAVIANNPIERFVRRFDFANVNQDLLKVVLDASPAPSLDLGFEAIYKKNNYKDTALGRTDDARHEYYVSLSYGDPKAFRVMLFGDIEFLEYNSTHRVGSCGTSPSDPPQSGAGTVLSPCSPAAAGGPPPVHSSYTWNAKNKDKSWQVGLGADWMPMERLTVKASAIYAETTGTVDFAAQGGAAIAPPGLLPINNFDNTKRTSLNLKGTYRYTKQWEFTGGYAFEKYRYSDIGYDGFGYIARVLVAGVPTVTTSAGYMTGQFAFQPYTANIFYVLATYKFQ